MTPITEQLAEALRAAEQFTHVDVSRGPAIDGWENTRELITSALAEYDRLRTHPAEGGEGRDYVLVPREPTPEMCRAGFLSESEGFDIETPADAPSLVYRAMLAAAPPPQPVAPEERAGGVWMWVADKFVNRVHALVVSAPERGEAKAVAYPIPEDDSVLVPRTWLLELRDTCPNDEEQCGMCSSDDRYIKYRADAHERWCPLRHVFDLIGLPSDAPQPPPAPICGRCGKPRSELCGDDFIPATTPAPTFRDPTIEDVSKLMDVFIKRPFGDKDSSDMFAALKQRGFVVNAIGAKVGEAK